MVISFAGRPSDSPYVEQVWSSRSTGGGPFVSIAEGRLELVVSHLPDVRMVTVRGPETRATVVDCPPGGEWFAVRFRPGVHMPTLPAAALMDFHNVNLPVAEDGSFVLGDIRWSDIHAENAEAFVHRLVRTGFIRRDATVAAVLADRHQPLSQKSVQRHFHRATGLTPGMFRRIEQARLATDLLRGGISILDAVHECGYFDQAHLTRSLRILVGQTPVQVQRGTAQLSFLYKTGR